MSEQRKIGVLVIGQSPRPDLLSAFGPLAHNLRLVEVGALDGIDIDLLPPTVGGDYPLTTSLRNGQLVTLGEELLAGLLQKALDQLEAEAQVEATVLLCAGPFESLAGDRPVIKPFAVTIGALLGLGVRNVGVVCPYIDQVDTATERWARDGIVPTVWVKPTDRELESWLPEQVSKAPEIEAVVLDFVGYPSNTVSSTAGRLHVPLIDPGRLAANIAASLVSGTKAVTSEPSKLAEFGGSRAYGR